MVAIHDDAIQGSFAHSPRAGGLQKITFDEVDPLGGGVGHVPLPLQARNGFQRVVEVYTGEPFAALRTRQRRQSDLSGDHELWLLGEELGQSGDHVAARSRRRRCCVLLHQRAHVRGAARGSRQRRARLLSHRTTTTGGAVRLTSRAARSLTAFVGHGSETFTV